MTTNEDGREFMGELGTMHMGCVFVGQEAKKEDIERVLRKRLGCFIINKGNPFLDEVVNKLKDELFNPQEVS